MRMFSVSYKFKNRTRSKYIILTALLLAQSLFAITLHVSTASAAPVFSNYPITSPYKKPAAMTVAGGAFWYLESSNTSVPSSNYIGKMTTSGVTTDYAIGYPPLQSSFTVEKLITGPDGNVWFIGSTGGGEYVGKLDISTGAVTFYTGGAAYSAGNIASGSDGKIYYSYKYSGGPANSYLRSLDPTTGATAAVQTYDTYSVLGHMSSGPDGRLYIIDGHYNRIYALSLTGGTNDTFSFSTYLSNITAGPDGNMWFVSSGKIAKMTTSGVTTEYPVPSGVDPTKLVAGPDGAMWFVDDTPSAPKIGRISLSGFVNMYTIPGTGVSYEVGGPVLGPDNAIWFDYYIPGGTQALGRLTTVPTFSANPITTGYSKPGAVTVAGGDFWYLESSNSSVPSSNYIGKMTAAGVTTDYAIGYPPLQTSFTVEKLITGPDGNVWCIGSTGGGEYICKLNISTGVVTFYTGGSAYSAGNIAAGSDGKIYYSYKYAGSPANSYLRSLDPATGTTAAVQTYDASTFLGSMTTGSDGRLYIGDGYYNRIYARSLTGGTNSTFTFSRSVGSITSGLDGNIWFASADKIVKVTTAGVSTEYTLPTGVRALRLVAGPDGAIWFVDDTPSSPKIGRITTNGDVVTYAIPGVNVSYEVGGPVLGPDGAIWFTYRNNAGQFIGRLGY